ncbi:pre-rRNA-processing protein ESF2-like [Lycium barbarum]|uniref:pre-rRNA-processing protein ESF2-like n=1 Tax=Lycium barbarum TaxID=112863 RepID=UPI00293E01D5|nr:pre-rRNA-processing protein ESF2-like [Lycium barbarum]XP_060180275.1 pre-rRNA-processing protein ESF2-like [Lycium barbarum]
MGEKDLEIEETSPTRGEEQRGDEAKTEVRKVKKKKKSFKEGAKVEKRGVCHVSRVPPRMDHVKLRQVLTQFGEIQRIYLVPEAAAAQMNRKRAGGFRGQAFSEGWIEFTKKSVAKRVANTLNGQQMGGRKRSSFHYDIWNVKYLSKIKWDDVTDEIAQRHAVREQKLALELSAAKRERDFYLAQVDKSHALSSIEERMKKKQKVQQESGVTSDFPSEQFAQKVIRQFSQKKPVVDEAGKIKPKLSKDVLAGVFGGQ